MLRVLFDNDKECNLYWLEFLELFLDQIGCTAKIFYIEIVSNNVNKIS